MALSAKTKIEKIQSAVTLANSLYAHGRTVHSWYTSRNQFTATVEEDAFGYEELMKWMNERIVGNRYRFIVHRDGILRYLDAKDEIEIEIDGYSLSVSMGSADDSKAAAGRGSMMQPVMKRDVLTFTSQGIEGINALEGLLEKCREKAAYEARVPCLCSFGSYGWEGDDLPKRLLDSVFLPEGEKESLLADINEFIESSAKYEKIGIPWHRGYMLYGPPGNGKSSLALAIANEMRMSLYTLNLSSVTSDRQLVSAIEGIDGKAILLLEDIDIFSKTVSRESEKEKPTLAGLLNALDGVNTPNGLITFITTNHEEVLDPALVRPGRIDYKMHLLPPVDSQVRNMFNYVFDEKLEGDIRQFDSMAELTNVFKTHLGDAEGVKMEVKANG